MKKIFFIGAALMLTLLAGGCEDSPPDPIIDGQASEKKQFVWEGLNYWYLWQQEVPQLGDDYFETEQAYQEYLMGFTDAEALFDALQYSEDEYSWFIEDYEQQEQAFKGISKSFGFSFGLLRISNSNDLFGYVQYVLSGSPAEEAGLVRGDLFTGINGSTITDSNYQSLLASDTYELTMAVIENDIISETGEMITINAEVLQENPVFLTKVIDTASVKVGYMVYNAFRYNYHQELNEAFGELASQGVDELVLDLRYNGGGALITSAMLAGLISGVDSTNIFTRLMFNQKRAPEENVTYPVLARVPIYDEEGSFVNWTAMNSLTLDQVYILTGFGTASASEALINGLKPYIDVTLIGEETEGKDVGSITVYDSPPTYDSKENVNPNHTIAMQPIVFRYTNANDQTFPDGGFTPDYEVIETSYLDSLPPLGDPGEPLLAQALALITGQPLMKLQVQDLHRRPIVADSRDLKPFGKELYLLPEYVEELNLVNP